MLIKQLKAMYAFHVFDRIHANIYLCWHKKNAPLWMWSPHAKLFTVLVILRRGRRWGASWTTYYYLKSRAILIDDAALEKINLRKLKFSSHLQAFFAQQRESRLLPSPLAHSRSLGPGSCRSTPPPAAASLMRTMARLDLDWLGTGSEEDGDDRAADLVSAVGGSLHWWIGRQELDG
jgi:hypothetical protein